MSEKLLIIPQFGDGGKVTGYYDPETDISGRTPVEVRKQLIETGKITSLTEGVRGSTESMLQHVENHNIKALETIGDAITKAPRTITTTHQEEIINFRKPSILQRILGKNVQPEKRDTITGTHQDKPILPTIASFQSSRVTFPSAKLQAADTHAEGGANSRVDIDDKRVTLYSSSQPSLDIKTNSDRGTQKLHIDRGSADAHFEQVEIQGGSIGPPSVTLEYK